MEDRGEISFNDLRFTNAYKYLSLTSSYVLVSTVEEDQKWALHWYMIGDYVNFAEKKSIDIIFWSVL